MTNAKLRQGGRGECVIDASARHRMWKNVSGHQRRCRSVRFLVTERGVEIEAGVANATSVRSRSAVLRRAVLCLSCLIATHWACGHPNVDEALSRINALIAESPRDALLFLRRAELHAVHGDTAAAEMDFATAARLQPRLPHLARLQGWFLLKNDRALMPLRSSIRLFGWIQTMPMHGFCERART